jgi:hypothetical protein
MLRITWLRIFIILVLFGAWKYWDTRPVELPPGIIVAPNDPIQTRSSGNVFLKDNYRLESLANFEIEARVLGKETYHLDREAELAPIDLAVGWGPMSDSAVLGRLEISQSSRFYYYRWEGNPPLPPSVIASHSTNMHLIPANPDIESRLNQARVGQVVHIVGELVEARASDGWHWRSSLTREDTGAGACELVIVESVELR